MSYASQHKLDAPEGKKNKVIPSDDAPIIVPEHAQTTLPHLRRLFANNSRRREMWHKMISFLALPICSRKFSHLYIDGGFISLKEAPRDIDVVLQTREPYGPAAFRAIEPFFAVGLESIRETFTVHLHFWMENAPPGMIDFRSFFARNRRSDHAAIMQEAGLFRISLLEPDIRETLRREIEAATAHR